MKDLVLSLQQRLEQWQWQYGLKLDKVAVAVSGGADSLALVLLLQRALWNADCQIVALTVNHHLREEADEEAVYVANLMARFGIEHHILHWKHGEIVHGMEEKARLARYRLLSDWCRQNNVTNLMTAHHQKDQAETFLMRLQRGSGLDGLAAIAPVADFNGLRLWRPLLDANPDYLRSFLQEQDIMWMTDASNDCDDFLRVRVRKLLPLLEDEIGLSVARIAGAAKALNEVKEYFADLCTHFIAAKVQQLDDVAVCFAPPALNSEPAELQRRILARLLKKIGDKRYAPSYEELEHLRAQLSQGEIRGCTLGGCEIFSFRKNIWIIPENREKGLVLRRQWQDFCRIYPQYQRQDLPYKLKKLLMTRHKNEKPVAFCE